MKFLFSCLLLVAAQLSFSQGKDSIGKDSLHSNTVIINKDTAFHHFDSLRSVGLLSFKRGGLEDIVRQNKLLNLTASPINFIMQEKKAHGKEFLFYALIAILLLTAMLKVFYSRYFSTIFRVYFNTSLRQNQLTDILIQEKLPSLIFNILYLLSCAFYSWLVINHYRATESKQGVIFIPVAFLFLSLVYLGKLCVIKVLGWITNSSEATNTYVFIIFLINKIIGLLIVPVVILLAFAPEKWQHILIIMSFFLLGILFISRYIRSYGLLKHKLMLGWVHFILYVIGIEVLPLFIIIKAGSRFLI